MSNLSSLLKIYTATYVAESDLSKEDKIWLIDFIKEGEYQDVVAVLEGEYQLPALSQYDADALNEFLSEADEPLPKGQTVRVTRKPPPIPKRKPGANPLRIRSNFGTSKLIGKIKEKQKVEKVVRKMMPDASKESVKAAKHFVKPYNKEIAKLAGKSALKVGGAAGAIALAAAGGHALYKNYMSRAARACKNKPNKDLCMAQFRKKAKATQNIHKIKKLRVSRQDCVNARNPLLCRNRIDKKIKGLKEDLSLFIKEREVLQDSIMGGAAIAFDIWFIFDIGGMVYRRFFSKAAKACKGAVDRRLCVLRYKVKAKEAQIKAMASKAGLCAKAKNPADCKSKLSRKLQSLKSDVAMLRQEVG